jgi:hypothetical protein
MPVEGQTELDRAALRRNRAVNKTSMSKSQGRTKLCCGSVRYRLKHPATRLFFARTRT